jgi:lysophospholipase L1-like esterase
VRSYLQSSAVAGTLIVYFCFGAEWLMAQNDGSPAAASESDDGDAASFDDHRHMMQQLGVRSLRRGADPSNPATYDKGAANRYLDSLPEALTMSDGTPITTPDQWRARRAELLELFSREVYGRVPADVPSVAWEVTETTRGEAAGVATITRTLVGRVDNSAHPDLEVNIRAGFTVPAEATGQVPMMLSFEGGFALRGGRRFGRAAGGTPWTEQAIAHGWGHGWISPHSIQPDNNQLRTGIIGLCNEGKPRQPDDWGALRAWAWGVSRLIDYFEQNPAVGVDATEIGIEGLSRFGKAALVTQAFDERVAVGFVGSSGQGGTKLHRRMFGETVENLTGGGYYWMAGNYLKYGASDPEMTAADLPVDAHQLIALCAPRPCFISYGTVEGGDPDWVDVRGSFMSTVLASPVYELLGAKGVSSDSDLRSVPLPAVGELVGGELAWRQHEGGHSVTPNWPTFFQWVGTHNNAPPVAPSERTQPPARRSAPTADEPAPRGDENSKIAHEDLLNKARYGATEGRVDVYFIGDSITRRWGCTDPQYKDLLDSWNDHFFGWNAANFAWGGDSTSNILWRLENGELEGLRPKVFVILAGTNNLYGTRDAAEVARGIKAIVDTCQSKVPDAKIILTAVFPRNDQMALIPVIREINQRIAEYANDERVRFLNLNDQLADEQGVLLEGMMTDGLHPARPGYEVWAAGLKPILTEWLGPPAAEDHAPPPTGDPSARR